MVDEFERGSESDLKRKEGEREREEGSAEAERRNGGAPGQPAAGLTGKGSSQFS